MSDTIMPSENEPEHADRQAERISELEAQLSIAGDALLKLQQYRDALIAERDAATARAEAATAESAAMREALELCPAPVPQTVPDRKLGIAEHQRISQLRAVALAPNAGANLLAELATLRAQAERDAAVVAAMFPKSYRYDAEYAIEARIPENILDAMSVKGWNVWGIFETVRDELLKTAAVVRTRQDAAGEGE